MKTQLKVAAACALALCFGISSIAHADPVGVDYVVLQKTLKKSTTTTAELLFEVFEDPNCTELIHSETQTGASPGMRPLK